MRKLKNRRIPNGTYGGVRGRRAEARLLLDVSDFDAIYMFMWLRWLKWLRGNGLRPRGWCAASIHKAAQMMYSAAELPIIYSAALLNIMRRTFPLAAGHSPEPLRRRRYPSATADYTYTTPMYPRIRHNYLFSILTLLSIYTTINLITDCCLGAFFSSRAIEGGVNS
ncbi:MAG: hypothetical protein ACFWUL_05625 [Dialister sp.]|jgi:hypothetical protein